MNRKILNVICLTLLICNTIVNVYATTIDKTNNSSDNSNQILTDNNTQFIKINDTVEIDKEINMILYVDNIPYDNFTFKLYSNNTLKDVNTEDIDLKNYNNEEISFDYCINCSNLKTITLNYKLPETSIVGDKITLNVELINKDNTLELIDYRTTVTIIETIQEIKNEQEKNSNSKSSLSNNANHSTNTSKSSSKSNVSTTYNGSSNNYLSNISIKGYTLNKNFIKERLTYFVTVPNNVKSLNISTTKEDSNASVNISGNSNFSVGINKVLIKVTAQDGRIKTYRIYVS